MGGIDLSWLAGAIVAGFALLRRAVAARQPLARRAAPRPDGGRTRALHDVPRPPDRSPGPRGTRRRPPSASTWTPRTSRSPSTPRAGTGSRRCRTRPTARSTGDAPGARPAEAARRAGDVLLPGLHRRALPRRAAPGARRGPRDRPPRLPARGDGRDDARAGGRVLDRGPRGARPGRRRPAGRVPRADVGDDVRDRRAAARPWLPLRLQPDGRRPALRAGRATRRRRAQHRRDPGRVGARRLGAVRVRARAVRPGRHRGPGEVAGDVDRRAHRGAPARLVLHADRPPLPERAARAGCGRSRP